MRERERDRRRYQVSCLLVAHNIHKENQPSILGSSRENHTSRLAIRATGHLSKHKVDNRVAVLLKLAT